MSAPRPSGIVTLLTDFGLVDPFVGVMTGAILSRAPGVRVVDLCHGIRAQAIREAAFWLERCYHWFPAGTVHVAVVDPGVGSERRVLAAQFGSHYFLGPDNGLFSAGLVALPDARVFSLELGRLALPRPSATFHGRDIFAPIAADLASGSTALEQLGAPAVPLPCALPLPVRSPGCVSGEIVTIDHYGNLLSNLDQSWLAELGDCDVCIAARVIRIVRTYSDAAPGELIALVNAFGVIEVAERNGNAAGSLNVAPGATIELRASC
jgi:S-adenosylmethionine hydrolase